MKAKARNIPRTIGRYALLFAALTALALLLLYLAGLAPQQAVFGNVQRSTDQFRREDRYPILLYNDDISYQFDNFTDALILNHSMCMDTRSDPLSILSNPGYFPREETGGFTPLDFLYQLEGLSESPAPDSYYSRYCMGFRAVVRPLLTVLTYPALRQLVAWTVLLLLTLVTAGLARRLGLLEALLFAACFLTLNPVVMMSSLQYCCCIILALCGVAAVLYGGARRFGLPALLFVLGAATQFFDFYTTPVITLVFPLCVYLLLEQREGSGLRLSQMLALTGKALLAWGVAYLATWACKLTLTELFTEAPGWSVALSSLAGHIGVTPPSGYGPEFYDPLRALRLCASNLYFPESAVLYVALVGLWVAGLIRSADRKGLLLRTAGYAVIALIPVLWILAAAEPSIIHYYFQYRTLGGTVLAVCCAAAGAMAERRRTGGL